MILTVIDIETTGLDPEKSQILQFGAMIEDTNNPLPYDQIPKFSVYIKHNQYTGEAQALHLNRGIFKILTENDTTKHKILTPSELFIEFFCWLAITHGFKTKLDIDQTTGQEYEYVKVILAGKNVMSFDWQFLKRLPNSRMIRPAHRVVDPVTLFIDFKNDEIPPSLSECKKRAGLSDIEVAHTVDSDNWDLIQVLRTKYNQ